MVDPVTLALVAGMLLGSILAVFGIYGAARELCRDTYRRYQWQQQQKQ